MRGFAVRLKICRKYAILLHKKLQLTGVENKASTAHFLRKIIQYSIECIPVLQHFSLLAFNMRVCVGNVLYTVQSLSNYSENPTPMQLERVVNEKYVD